MKQAAVDTSVMAVASVDKILERLVKCNLSLNTIRSGLSAFLEAKRSAFPRFFFLSDEEILDIVSNTRQPNGYVYSSPPAYTRIRNGAYYAAG